MPSWNWLICSVAYLECVSCSIVSDSLQPHGPHATPARLLSMEFPRQECWSGLPFPSAGDLPDPGIKPGFPVLQVDASPSEPLVKPSVL